MSTSDFTGRIKILNVQGQKTILVVKNGCLIEKIYDETIDSYRVGDLPSRSDTICYLSHSDPELDVMIAYDYNEKTNIATITYPTIESLYSDSQYEINCYLQDTDTESIEIMNDSGEIIKLEVDDFWINDDLDRILGLDMIDAQIIGRYYFNEYSKLFYAITGDELEYQEMSDDRLWICFSMRDRNWQNLADTSRAFKTKFPEVKFDLRSDPNGGENWHSFTLL
ncbi:MAG TPA: hypothetical protein V6C58_21240 [Allocoleopsis sp.]